MKQTQNTNTPQHTSGPLHLMHCPNGHFDTDAEVYLLKSDCGGLVAEYYHKADAVLGKTAPDLLEALEGVTQLAHAMFMAHRTGDFDSHTIDAAEAAIAKARGVEA